MRSNPVRLGLMAAALLGVIAFGGREAAALPVPAKTFNFAGWISDVTDPTSITGIHLHDHITGSITFSPVLSDDPDHDFGFGTNFIETGSFAFSGPSSGPFNVTGGSGNPAIQMASLFGSTTLSIGLTADADNSIDLIYSNSGSYSLHHLSSLQADAASLASLLGAGFTGQGFIDYQGASLQFTTIAPTATPIPAALWLFVSAVGGFGLVGLTRRRQVANQA